ncbi:MAG: hypothetical protein KatS3mg108_0220 [Isosphaeraceae bacterium]|jgi:hypothetical protein|nr:MAG: hypothetical protein KatS3mg108_0220 [Isosphaeraceae bacterium]
MRTLTHWLDGLGDRFAVVSGLAIVGSTLLTMGVGLMVLF